MPGERVELSAPLKGGDVLIPHLARAFGPAVVRQDRRVWTLTAPAKLDLKELGEIELGLRDGKAEIILPQGWAGWIREVYPQNGRPVPRPGRRQVHVALLLPVPCRLPLLGVEFRLALVAGG